MNALAQSGLPVEVIIVLICVITAYPTGSVQTPAAILIPIILTITTDMTLLRLYTSLTLIVSIYSYFFSPVHMCQLLSIEYFGTDLRSLLKEYGIFIPLFGVGIAAWYIITKAIVL